MRVADFGRIGGYGDSFLRERKLNGIVFGFLRYERDKFDRLAKVLDVDVSLRGARLRNNAVVGREVAFNQAGVDENIFKLERQISFGILHGDVRVGTCIGEANHQAAQSFGGHDKASVWIRLDKLSDGVSKSVRVRGDEGQFVALNLETTAREHGARIVLRHGKNSPLNQILQNRRADAEGVRQFGLFDFREFFRQHRHELDFRVARTHHQNIYVVFVGKGYHIVGHVAHEILQTFAAYDRFAQNFALRGNFDDNARGIIVRLQLKIRAFRANVNTRQNGRHGLYGDRLHNDLQRFVQIISVTDESHNLNLPKNFAAVFYTI